MAEMNAEDVARTVLAIEAKVGNPKGDTWVKPMLARALVIAIETLESVAGSLKWGEDTAIKRTITAMQNDATEALAKIRSTTK
jgi:hypothetical protein